MLAMPVKAMAHDWDHGGWGHEHHDNGNHNGWYKHDGGNGGWGHHHGDHDGDENQYQGQGYYPPPTSYGYGYRQAPYYNNYGKGYGYGSGYGNGYGYGYGRQGVPANGEGMISRTHPGLMWTCDSQGHHCHWAPRPGYGTQNYGYNNGSNGYYGSGGYGNGYYGNSPLGGLGGLFGTPANGAYRGYGNTRGYGNNGYYGNSPLGGLGSLLGVPIQ